MSNIVPIQVKVYKKKLNSYFDSLNSLKQINKNKTSHSSLDEFMLSALSLLGRTWLHVLVETETMQRRPEEQGKEAQLS